MPRLKHGAILGDLILPFLGLLQRGRVDILQADEDPVNAGPARLVDEAADLVGHGVYLGDDMEAQPILFAHPDQSVEHRLPVPVPREVVIGDEEVMYTLSNILSHDTLDIVRIARTRFAPLNVDDRTEAAQERAAAASV